MKKIYIATLFTVLSLLTFKNTNAQCVANYSLTIGTGGNVTFTSTSVGTSSNTMYYWAFGDGGTFTAFNNIFASHTYTANGSYSAYLFIYDTLATSTCSAGIAFTVPITGLACGGSASFSSTTLSSGLVNFNSTSTGVAPNSTYSWNFGDGNTTNTGLTTNAAHTYTAGGTYTITMIITDPLAICSYTTSQTVSVTIIPCNLVASFTSTNGAAGLVNFTSTSTGTTSNTNFFWDFGDGFLEVVLTLLIPTQLTEILMSFFNFKIQFL
ncbi:MAG: PKD domain-containing protein [Sphingobacteriaceae bacterium]|nr:PKD domain-containing protein [Sphingobacteriaceae bacterium]